MVAELAFFETITLLANSSVYLTEFQNLYIQKGKSYVEIAHA